MKTSIWLVFTVVLVSCSLLNEDEPATIDCAANMFATDCQDGKRLGCNADGEVVAVDCADTLTCKVFNVNAEEKGVCAPDCEQGSTSKVCEGNLLIECAGNQVTTMDCGAMTCTPIAGMGAECQ